MAVKAPRLAPPAATTWSGCYVGGNIGGGRSHVDLVDPPTGLPDDTLTPDGVAGGGQIGCDFQSGAWVFGVQGEFDATGWKNSQPEPLFLGFSDTEKNPWFATVTGRVGYTITPTTLLYAKGGAAWMRDEIQNFFAGTLNGTADVTRGGYDIGAGAEWMFAPSWSLFVEYNHLGFGSHTTAYTQPGGGTFSVYHNNEYADVGLFGINYHFGLH
jgi:outer membrane immunogenic protein